MNQFLKTNWFKIIIAVAVLIIALSSKNLRLKQEKEEMSLGREIISCSRETRLDNQPQYDRALSLIQQRIDENNEYWVNTKHQDHLFTYFPSKLINCIKIYEKDLGDSTDILGYFTLDDKNIKTDYYPIIVNPAYTYTDDITIAFLLVHEIKHVQQYIDILNGKEPLSCIDQEIEAFITQSDFYPILNDDEISSVNYRIKKQDEIFLPRQLKILKTMFNIKGKLRCGSESNIFEGLWDGTLRKCQRENLYLGLKEILINDSYYREQCGL